MADPWDQGWDQEAPWEDQYEWSWEEHHQQGDEINAMAKGKSKGKGKPWNYWPYGGGKSKGKGKGKTKEKERIREKAKAKRVKNTKEKEPKDHRGGKRRDSATTVKNGVISLEIALPPQKKIRATGGKRGGEVQKWAPKTY